MVLVFRTHRRRTFRGDSTLRTGLECPGPEMFQSYNVALGGLNLSPRLFSPQVEHR